MYARGEGVPQDYAEALTWYRLAAGQGDINAQGNLGHMYAHGEGVRQDCAEGLKWYRLAADQGDVVSQANLGTIYFRGECAPQQFGDRNIENAADQCGEQQEHRGTRADA
jgi:hypothetical protein